MKLLTIDATAAITTILLILSGVVIIAGMFLFFNRRTREERRLMNKYPKAAKPDRSQWKKYFDESEMYR
jgi:hypothetical protein